MIGATVAVGEAAEVAVDAGSGVTIRVGGLSSQAESSNITSNPTADKLANRNLSMPDLFTDRERLPHSFLHILRPG